MWQPKAWWSKALHWHSLVGVMWGAHPPFPKRLVRDPSPRTAHGVAGCSQPLSLAWLLAALMG